MVEGAQENIRLEFKRDYPGRSNMLKKLSAFANTYGGYLILGVDEDGMGRVKALNGIEPISRLDQKIIQWCFDEIYPPIIPYISPPIPHPEEPGKVFYVIYVEQSLETPHVLNKSRNGLYVRTDEYSQKFLTRLAKFDELEFLMNKRRMAEEFLSTLLVRANRRLNTHKVIKFEEHHGTDSLLKLILIPFFPQNRMFEPEHLIPYAQNASIKARNMDLPDFSYKKIHSQFESIISENPGVSYYSYFEINIYNMLFYVCDVTREYREIKRQSRYSKVIPTKVIMAEIILFFRYALNFYNMSGFDGILKLMAVMENVKGRQIRLHVDKGMDMPISYLDNQLQMERSYSIMELKEQKNIAIEIFRELCFSLGAKHIYSLSSREIEEFYEEGLEYLGWK
ncbi:MAG: helix-turn-helix domain-containing protein [Vulcanimicrobiota bacterium]